MLLVLSATLLVPCQELTALDPSAGLGGGRPGPQRPLPVLHPGVAVAQLDLDRRPRRRRVRAARRPRRGRRGLYRRRGCEALPPNAVDLSTIGSRWLKLAWCSCVFVVVSMISDLLSDLY